MYRAPGGRRPSAVPEGYTTSNDKVSSGQQVLSGWAVRYASPKCEFCRNDKQWSSLSAELQRLGLQIFAISPSANDAYPLAALVPRESRQEAYVSIEWIKQFRLRTTPTLLIFGADGRLIWCHRKTLSFDDKEAAIRAVSMAIKQRK